MQIIFAELDNIAKAGPSEGDLNKVKEFMLKKHAEDLKENSYWLGSIDEYLFTGMNPIKDYEQIVNSITVKDIQHKDKYQSGIHYVIGFCGTAVKGECKGRTEEYQVSCPKSNPDISEYFGNFVLFIHRVSFGGKSSVFT